MRPEAVRAHIPQFAEFTHVVRFSDPDHWSDLNQHPERDPDPDPDP